ncbi:MAG: hypothetical protein O2954_04010 [bacterium]|nr:hypothetical protein [bacterium]
MPKPSIFLCFDTEDPIHPEADDALLRLANLYRKTGLPACFFMVGEKARILRQRGRKDILDALRPHEIEYHGNHWFEYPEPALVYGNRDPWDEAVEKALAYETLGLNDIAEITGQFPVATCQHQNNHSPATTHALHQAGIKVWNGGLGAKLNGMGWIMGLFVVGRHSRSISSQGSWGGFQFDPERPNRRPSKMNPDAELKRFQERFDAQLEQNPSHVVILGHPTCWALADWWGWYEWSLPFRHAQTNGAAGPYPHGRNWERGILRSAADTDAHFEWTEAAAKWMARRNDIHITTFANVYTEHADPAGLWLTGNQIRSAAKWALKRFDHLKVGKTTLSAADLLYVLAQYVEFLMQEHRRPDHLQIRRTLGPVEAVYTPTRPVTFKRADLLLGARQLVHYVNAHGRLPHAVRCHAVDTGPGELLLALAQAIAAERLPDTITVEPTSGVPECASMDCFTQPTAGSTHAPPGYTPDQIALQSRLQSWSYRPAIRQ